MNLLTLISDALYPYRRAIMEDCRDIAEGIREVFGGEPTTIHPDI